MQDEDRRPPNRSGRQRLTPRGEAEIVADHTINARLHTVEMIEILLADGQVMMLTRMPGDKGEYHAEIWSGKARKRGIAETLESAVEECTQNPRRKVCIRPECSYQGRPLPLSRFTPDRDSKDGHAATCKECENERVNRFNQERKAKRRRGTVDGSQPSPSPPAA